MSALFYIVRSAGSDIHYKTYDEAVAYATKRAGDQRSEFVVMESKVAVKPSVAPVTVDHLFFDPAVNLPKAKEASGAPVNVPQLRNMVQQIMIEDDYF